MRQQAVVHVNVTLPKDLWHAFRALAVQRGITAKAALETVIREAVAGKGKRQ